MEDSTKYPLLTDNNILVDDEDDDQGVGLKISIDHHKPVQVIKGGWKSAIYIIGVEVAERFAFAGTSGNLITYLTDVLGQSTAEAAQKVNVWSGVATLLPILGAIIADSYLGRFDTILISSIIYIMERVDINHVCKHLARNNSTKVFQRKGKQKVHSLIGGTLEFVVDPWLVC